MINSQNRVPLEYWKNTLVDEERVQAICRDIDRRLLFARIDFKTGGDIGAVISNHLGDTGQGHFITVMDFFRAVSAYKPEQPLEGTIYVFLEDGMFRNLTPFVGQLPLFSFGRHSHDYQSFLMPDPAFIESEGYKADKAEMDAIEATVPWNEKEPVFFWRGASSNREFQGADWRKTQRFRFCLAAREHHEIDARISKVVDFGGVESETGLHAEGLVGEYVPFNDFLRYKYLVDIDGMCCAWMSFFKKMYSSSAVVKMDSDYSQWFHHELTPWEHYIPLRDDLNDLQELIAWSQTHDGVCERIAAAGRQAVARLTVKEAIQETHALLEQFFGYQRALKGVA